MANLLSQGPQLRPVSRRFHRSLIALSFSSQIAIACAQRSITWQFRAKVQLFAGLEVQPNVYTVQLGRNPSRIDYSGAYGDFFAYYPKEDRREFDGEASELIGTKRFV